VLQVPSDVHDRHAAPANLAAEAIASPQHFGERNGLVGEDGFEPIGRDAFERRIRSLALRDEALKLGLPARIAAAQLRQQRGSAMRRRVEHGVDERLEPPPLVE
jgi:hypothetical protein